MIVAVRCYTTLTAFAEEYDYQNILTKIECPVLVLLIKSEIPKWAKVIKKASKPE